MRQECQYGQWALLGIPKHTAESRRTQHRGFRWGWGTHGCVRDSQGQGTISKASQKGTIGHMTRERSPKHAWALLVQWLCEGDRWWLILHFRLPELHFPWGHSWCWLSQAMFFLCLLLLECSLTGKVISHNRRRWPEAMRHTGGLQIVLISSVQLGLRVIFSFTGAIYFLPHVFFLHSKFKGNLK